MNKIFCPSCGTKLFYGVEKPNFCTSCGKALSLASTAKETVEETKGEDYVSISIDKLDIEIEDNRRASLWEVMNEKRNHYPSNTSETQRS